MVLYLLIFFVAPGKVGEDKIGFTDKFSPRLGLDLEGGTQIELLPKSAVPGEKLNLTNDSIDQAVSIIRQRVDGFGVAEAEVTKQGTGNGQTILISIPGNNKDVLQQVQQTAELRFRQVLVATSGAPTPAQTPSPTPAPTGSASPGATPSASASGSASSSPTPNPSATLAPAPTASSNGRALLPQGLRAATTPAATPSSVPAPLAPAPSPATPAASTPAPASPTAAATPAPASPTAAATPPAAAPTLPADDPLNQLTPAQTQAFTDLDCTKQEPADIVDAPTKLLITCDRDGAQKYILGPASLIGTDVSSATAGLGTNSQGISTGEWQVNLSFTGKGQDKFTKETSRITSLTDPRNRLAITLDGQVVSAPTINEAIAGDAQISGGFTHSSADDLADVLKYGALPLSFTAGTAQEVSPELGRDSLHGGLIAGGIGLGLVVLYMLTYYRRLGLIAIASLVCAGVVSLGLVALLGWQIGYRLNLAGIAGLIVSIGITADSFVIYFERLRDEVRDGKSVRVAVETGWARARRTIISSDVVSLLAAGVLYFLSTASVKGFAFTLGLTTFVDLAVIFFFTKPLVTLFARSKRLSSGRQSGLDPARLGADQSSRLPAPASPSLALARSRERRLAAEAAAGGPAGVAGKES